MLHIVSVRFVVCTCNITDQTSNLYITIEANVFDSDIYNKTIILLRIFMRIPLWWELADLSVHTHANVD